MRFDCKISYLTINSLSNNKIIGVLENIEKDILVYIHCYICGSTTEEGIWYAWRGAAMKQILPLFSAIQQKQSSPNLFFLLFFIFRDETRR